MKCATPRGDKPHLRAQLAYTGPETGPNRIRKEHHGRKTKLPLPPIASAASPSSAANRIPLPQTPFIPTRPTRDVHRHAARPGWTVFNLHGERLGEVVGGAVMKHARDFNLVRESVLSTTLSRDTPAFDIQQPAAPA